MTGYFRFRKDCIAGAAQVKAEVECMNEATDNVENDEDREKTLPPDELEGNPLVRRKSTTIESHILSTESNTDEITVDTNVVEDEYGDVDEEQCNPEPVAIT